MTPPFRQIAAFLCALFLGVFLGWMFRGPVRPGVDGVLGEAPAVTMPAGDPGLLGSGATALAIDDPRISFRQLKAVAGRLALSDPESAVRNTKTIPGHDNREAYLGEVLRTWGETDGLTAANFAREFFQGEQLGDALYYVADGWAESDPKGVAEWFAKHTTGPTLDDAMWEALEAWGRKNPAEAFAWSAHLDDYVKSTAMQGLAEGWGAVDPAGAAAAGLEMKDSDHGEEFLVSVATQWAGAAPRDAAAWAGSLVDERLRALVSNELGEIWSHTDPSGAAAWAASLEDPGTKRAAETGIAVGWSEHDPAGAIDWALAAITDESQLDEIVGDITFNWSHLDSRGATKWLESQEPGERTDKVLSTFSEMVLADDPEAAVAWANRIDDSSKRDATVRRLLDSLVADYGEGARKAIQGFAIPDEIKRLYTPLAE